MRVKQITTLTSIFSEIVSSSVSSTLTFDVQNVPVNVSGRNLKIYKKTSVFNKFSQICINTGFLKIMHPAGIEPASQESESYVLSIILRLQLHGVIWSHALYYYNTLQIESQSTLLCKMRNTSCSCSIGSCPGALACSPAPKVTQDPKNSPATREIHPCGPMDMVISGWSG